jgi:hypothetical protein
VAGQQVPIERRQGQRRAEPRDTWRTLGFVIIESDSHSADASSGHRDA